MFDSVLIRRRTRMIRVPGFLWRRMVRVEGRQGRRRLGFFAPAHHQVRDFVVSEIGRIGMPVSPQRIAESTEIPIERVTQLLGELERNMTFIFRSNGHDVDWAYPVTADRTPHRVRLDSGERFFGA